MARMRAAGVQVDELPAGPLADLAHEINSGFFSRMQRGRPWVRLKAAISLDGRIALPNGQSQWITGAAARADGHAWRKRAGAILTGIGTVLADDPRLDVRLVPTALQPLRVVLDSRLRTPPTAQLLKAPGKVLLYASQTTADPRQTLASLGVEISTVAKASGNSRIDLGTLLTDLGQRGINELHVEAGQQLNGAFIREGWVDEYLIYMAPLLLGPGRDLADLGPFEQLQQGTRLQFHDLTSVGDDLRIMARPR
jgi:diaminohydroxyphosphoribosylaminopyrimidine deaminase/5-amino-6-(5-phosphoribosylamino)uracil reductase